MGVLAETPAVRGEVIMHILGEGVDERGFGSRSTGCYIMGGSRSTEGSWGRRW